MKNVVDITEKLSFDENPKLIIKDREYEVNADAETILKVMGLMGDGHNVRPDAVREVYELLFKEKDRKTISGMKLLFKDFQQVIMSAIDLATGGGEPGEQ